MNSTERRHLDRAITISRESTCDPKHGVVIAQGPRVLAVAVNTKRNNPNIVSNPRFDAHRHAEWNAFKQLEGLDLSKATLYSARTSRTGKVGLAKPCEQCQAMIDLFGVKRVIHT